jgi:hypothetical protein
MAQDEFFRRNCSRGSAQRWAISLAVRRRRGRVIIRGVVLLKPREAEDADAGAATLESPLEADKPAEG